MTGRNICVRRQPMQAVGCIRSVPQWSMFPTLRSLGRVNQIPSHMDVDIIPNLTSSEKASMRDLLVSFSDVLTDVPGRVSVIEHKIILTSEKPVCLKPYRLPFRSRELVEKEIRDMLELDVIEPSTSPYSSPIVLVNKPDGTVRFCIDFRRLNAITVLDTEPIPYQEEIIASFGTSVWFFKLDLTKGYWEIPLDKASRPYTAFQTPLSLFQFNARVGTWPSS